MNNFKVRNVQSIENRLNWIDWAKALGITMVVMGHSNYNIPFLSEMIFMIHMPLFFFISGFLYKANKTFKDISLSNWKTLILPYILFNLISAMFALLIGSGKYLLDIPMNLQDTFVSPLKNSLLGIPGNLLCGVTWFLLALVWCRYLTSMLHHSIKWISLLGISTWAVAFIFKHYFDLTSYYCIFCGVAGFIWFELGYILKNKLNQIIVPKWVLIVLVPLGFCICFYILKVNGQCNYLAADTKGIIGLLGTGMGLLSFLSLCKLLDNFNLKVITAVSNASILIMGTHMLVMLPLQKILNYQYRTVVTLVVDVLIVLSITLVYPMVRKLSPQLIGYRK